MHTARRALERRRSRGHNTTRASSCATKPSVHYASRLLHIDCFVPNVVSDNKTIASTHRVVQERGWPQPRLRAAPMMNVRACGAVECVDAVPPAPPHNTRQRKRSTQRRRRRNGPSGDRDDRWLMRSREKWTRAYVRCHRHEVRQLIDLYAVFFVCVSFAM